jgi:2-polyprenyl-6-methoxyphenol hydroxylase-like FAD-dependent oxidoreductase
VQRYLATTLAKHRIFLAGDAGHIISPIGGQGMNLGWLDAWDAATVMRHLLNNHHDEKQIQNYSLRRLRATNIALSRAEFNMLMGRKTRWAPLKYALARVLIRKPFVTRLAHMFTMRGL